MTPLFAFLAGVVTVLSPCVLPLLPVILASSTLHGRLRPIGVVVGFVTCFTGVTLALSILVQNFAISPNVHRTAAALIFIVLGLLLAIPYFKLRFEMIASQFAARFAGGAKGGDGFFGGVATGAGLGLAWTPCVGPIMAAVITLAMNQETTVQSLVIALAFSMGTALPMALAIFAGNRLYSRIAFLKRNSARIQQAMGLLILLVGLGIWFGFDRLIQIELFRLFPAWDATLTGWERSVVD